MTTVTLRRWGRAQAARIPEDVCERLGLCEGDRLEAEVVGEAIVLTPEPRSPRVMQPADLKELFADRTEPYDAGEDPFDPPMSDKEDAPDNRTGEKAAGTPSEQSACDAANAESEKDDDASNAFA